MVRPRTFLPALAGVIALPFAGRGQCTAFPRKYRRNLPINALMTWSLSQRLVFMAYPDGRFQRRQAKASALAEGFHYRRSTRVRFAALAQWRSRGQRAYIELCWSRLSGKWPSAASTTRSNTILCGHFTSCAITRETAVKGYRNA